MAPYGENRRYDLVLDLGDRFVRVQSKTARLTPDRGAIVAATASLAGLGATRRRVGYQGQVDLFAIFSPDTGRVYLVPVDECPGTQIQLRLTPPKNGQRRRVRYAADYELRPARSGAFAPPVRRAD